MIFMQKRIFNFQYQCQSLQNKYNFFLKFILPSHLLFCKYNSFFCKRKVIKNSKLQFELLNFVGMSFKLALA
jgi:hypothetical protein